METIAGAVSARGAASARGTLISLASDILQKSISIKQQLRESAADGLPIENRKQEYDPNMAFGDILNRLHETLEVLEEIAHDVDVVR